MQQMAKFKHKHDNDKKGRIVKTDVHTLPEHYSQQIFDIPVQDLTQKTELQVVLEVEEDEILLDYKKLMNDLYGDYGTFAEYNRNCMLFSYQITATLPSQEKVNEIREERERIAKKKAKYEQVERIKQMKLDRANIIDKLLQNINNNNNNNKLKLLD